MAYIGVSPSNGVRRKHTYTATSGQTSFSGAGAEGATLSYSDSNFVDVYQNGVKLAEEDYTATSGTAIVLAQGASADDIVEIIAFDVFSVADTVSKADGGTFDGNITAAGTLGVTGDITLSNIAGGAVFNEGGADVDFRVESDTIDHALFVNGADGNVGVGISSPNSKLTSQTATTSTSAFSFATQLNNSFASNSSIVALGFHNRADVNATGVGGAIALSGSAIAAGSGSLIFCLKDNSGIGNVVAPSDEKMRIITTGFTKHSDNGTYRAVAGNFHEFAVSTTSGALVGAFANASYADGGIQSIAVRAATGDTYRLFEGYSGNAADREFRVDSDGTVHADGAYSSSGGDYAEMFEWKDGNSSSEDRVGKTVVLDGNQIKLSTSNDAQATIIGVVSATPVVLGDAHDEKWIDKYETDSYGRYVLEEYTQTEWTEESTEEVSKGTKEFKTYQTDMIPSDVTVPDDAKVTSEDKNGVKLMRRKRNSSYDATQTYTPRVERKEFSAIGLVGKLRVTVGQTVGDRWIKMREISDTVHEYLVR